MEDNKERCLTLSGLCYDGELCGACIMNSNNRGLNKLNQLSNIIRLNGLIVRYIYPIVYTHIHKGSNFKVKLLLDNRSHINKRKNIMEPKLAVMEGQNIYAVVLDFLRFNSDCGITGFVVENICKTAIDVYVTMYRKPGDYLLRERTNYHLEFDITGDFTSRISNIIDQNGKRHLLENNEIITTKIGCLLIEKSCLFDQSLYYDAVSDHRFLSPLEVVQVGDGFSLKMNGVLECISQGLLPPDHTHNL